MALECTGNFAYSFSTHSGRRGWGLFAVGSTLIPVAGGIVSSRERGGPSDPGRAACDSSRPAQLERRNSGLPDTPLLDTDPARRSRAAE